MAQAFSFQKFRQELRQAFRHDGLATRKGKTQVYLALGARVIEHALEGFGVSFLPFAALNSGNTSAASKWGIGVPAFIGLLTPAIGRIFPFTRLAGLTAGSKAEEIVNKMICKWYPALAIGGGRELLSPGIVALNMKTDNIGTIILDIVGSLLGVLINLGFGNGLAKNGFVGLISSVLAAFSILLSVLSARYTFNHVDKIMTAELAPRNGEIGRLQAEIKIWLAAIKFRIKGPDIKLEQDGTIEKLTEVQCKIKKLLDDAKNQLDPKIWPYAPQMEFNDAKAEFELEELDEMRDMWEKEEDTLYKQSNELQDTVDRQLEETLKKLEDNWERTSTVRKGLEELDKQQDMLKKQQDMLKTLKMIKTLKKLEKQRDTFEKQRDTLGERLRKAEDRRRELKAQRRRLDSQKMTFPKAKKMAQNKIHKLQYLIAAPIILGIICAAASVIGAAFLFRKSGKAEPHEDYEPDEPDKSRRDEYLYGQVYPAAANFILVAIYLAEPPHLFFRMGAEETDLMLVVSTELDGVVEEGERLYDEKEQGTGSNRIMERAERMEIISDGEWRQEMDKLNYSTLRQREFNLD